MCVLGLGAVVVRNNVSQWAFHWCSNQGAILAGISDKVVEFSLVSHQSPSQYPSVSLVALREFADNTTGLVAVVGQPHLCLLLKRQDDLGDLQGGEKAGLHKVNK